MLTISAEQRKLKRPYTIADLSNVAPDIQLPMNAVEQRGSAHFQEINFRYYTGMTDIWVNKYEEIKEERDRLIRSEKLVRYAHPKYIYRERKYA